MPKYLSQWCSGMKQKISPIGLRVELPVHYDLWARGARFGRITAFRYGKDGQSNYVLVKMDHPQVRRRVKIWQPDWEYAKLILTD